MTSHDQKSKAQCLFCSKKAGNTRWRIKRGPRKAAFVAVAVNYTAHGLLFPLTNAVRNGVIAIPHAQPANFITLVANGLLFALPTLLTGYLLARLTPRHAIAAAALGGVICFAIAWLNWEVLVVLSPQSVSLNNVWATLGRPLLQTVLLVLTAWLTVRSENKRLPA